MQTPTATIFLPWHALDDAIQRGLRADQPAAAAVVPGTLYCVTDESYRLERSDGSAWALAAPTGGGSGGGTPDPHHVTHEPGGSDALVDAAWTDVSNIFAADQTIDGDLFVTGTVNPLTDAQRDQINALIGDPTGARTLMSSSFISGLSLRHDETVARGRIACGNYDTQTYQPLAFEVETLEVHTGVSPASRIEHLRVHPLGGVTVGAGADHASDPGTGIIRARGLDGTPLDATQLLSGTVPDARLSANVQLKPILAADLPAHATRHDPGGTDPLTVDAAAAVGSLRTLGTGATQAAPGNDARFTTLLAHHATHEPGGSDALLNVAWTNLANTFTANQTITGLLTVTGFGGHTFNASGAGGQTLTVGNLADGAGNYATVSVAVGSAYGSLFMFAPSYATSGANVAESCQLYTPGTGGLGVNAAHPAGVIRFYTGSGTLRATIAANGHVGLNTVPDAIASGQLNIETTGSNAIGIYVKGYSDAYAAVRGDHQVNSATAYAAFFYNGVAGNGQYLGNGGVWVAYSDRSLKTDIRALEVLARLRQVQPRDFLWTAHATSDRPGQRQFGFIAQEVQDVFPDLVSRAHDGKLGIAYTGLIAPLVQGWQNHDARLAALEARLNGFPDAE